MRAPDRFREDLEHEPAERPSPEEYAGLDEPLKDVPVPAWWPKWAQACGIDPPDPDEEMLF
jgi:hypothetical protein